MVALPMMVTGVLLVSFLRYVMLVESTELVVGSNIACEGKREMNYKESIIMIYTSGFPIPVFGIELSWLYEKCLGSLLKLHILESHTW